MGVMAFMNPLNEGFIEVIQMLTRSMKFDRMTGNAHVTHSENKKGYEISVPSPGDVLADVGAHRWSTFPATMLCRRLTLARSVPGTDRHGRVR